MAKRLATSELNHDNWNKEEEPEDAGVFRKATPDVIQNRVIKSAKRRSVGVSEPASEEKKSAFARFDGFKTNPSSSSSPFQFLMNSNSSKTPTLNGSNSNEAVTKSEPTSTITKSAEASSEEKSNEYYSKLKGLNESVSQWIKSHVDSNPFCILTPIFRDYERYLSDIDKIRAPQNTVTREDKTKAPSSDSFNSFSFKMTPSTPQNKETSLTKSSDLLAGSSPKTSSESSSETKAENNAVSSTSKQGEEESKNMTSGDPSGSSKKIYPFASNLGKPTPFFGTGKGLDSSAPGGFSFGSGKPFTFSNVVKPPPPKVNKEKEEEEEDQPPKVEFTPVVEEDAIFSKRCKVFVKKETTYQERGVGTLYLKPVPKGDKTQLIVRADTSLGNLLVNTLLNSSQTVQKMGKNNVMLHCIPTPDIIKPVPVLFKVKTATDADELFKKLQEYQK